MERMQKHAERFKTEGNPIVDQINIESFTVLDIIDPESLQMF